MFLAYFVLHNTNHIHTLAKILNYAFIFFIDHTFQNVALYFVFNNTCQNVTQFPVFILLLINISQLLAQRNSIFPNLKYKQIYMNLVTFQSKSNIWYNESISQIKPSDISL